MKKICVLLLAVALMLMCAGALAKEEYGSAVIRVRHPAGLHLREEPSSDAVSMGRFYAGTEVECRSDPNGTWVEVKIGRLRGYMKSAYLRRGKAADAVSNAFVEGVITAPNWANMRKGPSTEYQFMKKLMNGQRVTIMGVTENGWYYIEADGDFGFVSGSLVELDSVG